MVDGIPQVRHVDSSDLAGGNFAYMLGEKGGGASDAKGHNVIDFGNLEDTLITPPGFGHAPKSENLTCAGIYGCHGTADDMKTNIDGSNNTVGLHRGDPMASIAGAHHTSDSNIDGTTTGKSYRFLLGVTGLEVSDWQNSSSSHHNEYKGEATPNTPGMCEGCHFGDSIPAGSTITDLCTTCHVDMHTVDSGGDGIWLRHPSDIVIPNSGEYATYTTYNIDAPVGRVTVPATANNVVTPGTDVVTCLTCHFAHGSDYPDLLRWDYNVIVADGGSSTEGCFICHSTKDE